MLVHKRQGPESDIIMQSLGSLSLINLFINIMCFLNLLFMKSVRNIRTYRNVLHNVQGLDLLSSFEQCSQCKRFSGQPKPKKELNRAYQWGMSWNKEARDYSNQYKYYIFVMITIKASFLIHLRKNLLTSEMKNLLQSHSNY